MKNKSILQQTKECYLCRLKAEKAGYFGQLPSTGLHKHHFMHGTANRKLAEKYGLYAYVCERFHHEYGEESPHGNPAVDLMLKQTAQRYLRKSTEKTGGGGFFSKELQGHGRRRIYR